MQVFMHASPDLAAVPQPRSLQLRCPVRSVLIEDSVRNQVTWDWAIVLNKCHFMYSLYTKKGFIFKFLSSSYLISPNLHCAPFSNNYRLLDSASDTKEDTCTLLKYQEKVREFPTHETEKWTCPSWVIFGELTIPWRSFSLPFRPWWVSNNR